MMGLLSYYGATFFLLGLSLKICQSKDLLEECSHTEDSHVTRGSFTCCSSSPRGLPLETWMDFKAVWPKCALEPENKNEDPVISAWRVYRCIIFMGLKRKPLLPSTFAEMVTEKYPALMKTQIVSKMSEYVDEDMKFEVDHDCEARVPYPKVHLLRNLFYDTEQEICEGDYRRGGNYSSIKTSHSSSSLASSLCKACNRRHEMYHRNGDCCSQVAIPFPFIYLPFRYGNQGRVEDCVNDVVDDVGLPSDTTFSSHLKYLCYPSCEHYLSGTLKEGDIWSGANLLQSASELRTLVGKMTPKYFSPRYKQDIQRYVVDNFRSAWSETKTFESKMSPSQRDLRNCDKGKLKNLLASCKAHRLIETMMTLYLNGICNEKYAVSGGSSTNDKPSTVFESHEDEDGEYDWDIDIRRAHSSTNNRTKSQKPSNSPSPPKRS